MTRLAVRFVLPVLLVAAVMKPARADESGMIDTAPAVPLAAAPPAPVWYGGQVLAADGALAGLIASCLAGGGGDVCALPILGYFATGPIVHTANKGGLRGLASLGVRIGVPVVGIAIAAAYTSCPPPKTEGYSELCGLREVAIGGRF